jgi:hypothetical protein
MKSIIILGLLALIGVILYFTNPEQGDFKNFVQDYITTEFAGDSEVENALLNLASGPIAEMIEANTHRVNFAIGSIYEMDLGNKRYRFLGIASNFIPLQKNGPIEDAKESMTP